MFLALENASTPKDYLIRGVCVVVVMAILGFAWGAWKDR